MKFLVDRCAGRRLALWLRSQGHDVLESSSLGADPGDRFLLTLAAEQARALVTIDTDFGELVFVQQVSHAGIVRLPDVPAQQRILLMAQVLDRHAPDVEAGAVVTVRGHRIRITRPPARPPDDSPT